MFDKDYDDENWADPGEPSRGRSRPSNGNDNDCSEGVEDMQGGETRTGQGKRSKDGKGKGKGKATEDWKGKGKGNGEGNGIVK